MESIQPIDRVLIHPNIFCKFKGPEIVEPLSQRVLEVLQLITKGLSNGEISERLFLALDSVKGHNRRIYGKLGVMNCAQVINKAGSLNVLPPQ